MAVDLRLQYRSDPEDPDSVSDTAPEEWEVLQDQVLVAEGAKDVQGLYSRRSFGKEFWQGKLAVAKALVERYAATAPTAVQNEACLRVVAYLFDRPAGLTEKSGDGFTVAAAPGHTGALRHSGAMALLNPWKSRRARAI